MFFSKKPPVVGYDRAGARDFYEFLLNFRGQRGHFKISHSQFGEFEISLNDGFNIALEKDANLPSRPDKPAGPSTEVGGRVTVEERPFPETLGGLEQRILRDKGLINDTRGQK